MERKNGVQGETCDKTNVGQTQTYDKNRSNIGQRQTLDRKTDKTK